MLLRSLRPLLAPSAGLLAVPARTSFYRNHLRPDPMGVFGEQQLPNDDPRLFGEVAPASKWQPVTSNYDEVVSKFVGLMTKEGERDKAREIVRQAFAEIKHTQLRKRRQLPPEQRAAVDVNPVTILNQAVENCTPALELSLVVRGGIIYMVPRPPQPRLALHRAVLFILEAAAEKPSSERLYSSLARELLYAARNEGKAIRMKMELYKKCEENRAFAAFRSC